MGGNQRCGGVLLVVGALAAGCAVTPTTCPRGTRLTVAREPAGRAQWCAVTNTPMTALPVVGRAYTASLATGRPPALPGGVEGPFTSWFPDGAVASHGRYVSDGARSVPAGLWAFWRPGGQRWVLGLYQRGAPVGCFATWDADGTRHTGTVHGDQLHVAPCTPPPDNEMAIVEGRARPGDDTPPWADLTLQGFLGPNHLGAYNADQVRPDPGMTLALSATARVRRGRLRIGPVLGMRMGDRQAGLGLVAGGSVGWALPAIHPRLDAEVVAELAVQRLEVDAGRRLPPRTATLTFWSPLPAVQVGAAVTLSPGVAAVASVRVDGVPARGVVRDVVYCDAFCYLPVRETWDIGGFAYGVNLGLRLLLR